MDKEHRFDCKDEGCGECKVCEYLDFLEWANSVAHDGATIQYDREMDAYLKKRRIRTISSHSDGGKAP